MKILENTATEPPFVFHGIFPDLTTFLNSFNWAFNSTTTADVNMLRVKENEINLKDLEVTTKNYNSTTISYPENHNADSLSIMWYLASFGALVMFFLLISFSEVCCKKSFQMPPDEEVEVSPPPYDLFAPPPYDSLYEEKKEKNHKTKKKRKTCEVFVISVRRDKTTPTNLEMVQRNETGTGQIVTPPPPP